MFTRQLKVNAKVDTNTKIISKTKVIYLCAIMILQKISIKIIVCFWHRPYLRFKTDNILSYKHLVNLSNYLEGNSSIRNNSAPYKRGLELLNRFGNCSIFKGQLNPKIDFSSFEHLGIVEQLFF